YWSSVLGVYFFFFFQAEDGIRDWSVTGVQTCALPILSLVYLERRIIAFMQDRLGPNRVGPQGLLQPVADVIKLFAKEDIIPTNRSEERRVGKECRYRRSA